MKKGTVLFHYILFFIKPKEKLLQIYACCVCEAYRATETLPASIVRNASQVKNTIFFR
jgi:hypothetical protein